jgi:tetratricopeptide (TPR) repeat protein
MNKLSYIFNQLIRIIILIPVLGYTQVQNLNETERLTLRGTLQQEFLSFYDQERFQQSILPAKKIVALTKEIYGEKNFRLINPLNNLASAYYMVDDFENAQITFLQCIEIIESNQNIISPELISPLYGFALTLNRYGQYQEAITILERALRINHVNQGFHNLDQLKIHDTLTESLIGVKNFQQANHHQTFQVYVNKKHFGVNNSMVDESLMKLSNWYKRTGQIFLEREVQEELLERQTSRTTGQIKPLIETYKNISFSHRREGVDIYKSINPLKQALEKIDAMENTDLILKFEVLLDIGDTYTSYGRAQSGMNAYQECWGLIDEDPSMSKLIQERFSTPVKIRNILLPDTYPIPEVGEENEADQIGYISLRYAIGVNGKTTNIEVIESDPEGLIERVAVSAIKKTVYRPVYIEAEPQESSAINFRHEFLYSIGSKPKDSNTSEPEEKIEDKPLENPIA